MLVSATFRKVIQISTEGVLFYGPENCQKKYNQKMQQIHVKGVHPTQYTLRNFETSATL
jgi:hypothetical protein